MLVAAVVLLVEDDEADVRQRREQRRTRADHHLNQPFAGAPPGVVAFAFAQAAVDDGDLFGESSSDTANGLRGQRDFRHAEDGLPSLCQRQFDGAEVEFGLAAAGDAVKEEDVFEPFFVY